MKAAILLAALFAGCTTATDQPSVSVYDESPDAPPPPTNICVLLDPGDAPCCAQYLGCVPLERWCEPQHGTCVELLCPLTKGGPAHPGLCNL